MKKTAIILIFLPLISVLFAYSTKITPDLVKKSNIQFGEKIYCDATMEDDFADNRILVALKKEATEKFNKYSIEDFSEIECISVEDITSSTSELVKQQLEAERTGKPHEIEGIKTRQPLIDINTFRTILCIELEEKSKANVLEKIKILEQRDDVLLANPDYYVEFFADPNPLPIYYNSQWWLQKMQVPLAWDYTVGENTVVVGVMDSGIEGTHVDLSNRLARDLCANFKTGTVLTPNPTDSFDVYGHGTLVAGIIGAGVNVGTVGITGIAQNIRLASLEINDPDTAVNKPELTSAISSIHRAITFATNNQIQIINCSTGYRGNDEWATNKHKSTLETAIAGYPGLFVAAAGNEGWNNNNDPIYPASFNLPNLISVGASTANDSRLYKSCYGSTSVDVFAPGDGIYSTSKLGGYYLDSGTSFAAPHVSGVAALMLSVNPNLTAAQIKAAILDNVDLPSVSGNNPLQGLCVSSGRLNAFKAVASVVFTSTTNPNDNSKCTITGITSGVSLSSSITLPETLNGRTVTEIGPSAFANNQNLTNITIPSTVTYVGSNAFLGCSNLTINITGLTSIPSSWSSNFNPNSRPISFNGILCSHESYSYLKFQSNHTIKCNNCRATLGTSNHSYTNNGSHKVCECGFELCLGTHDLSYYANIGMGTHYQGCSSCDYMSSNQKCLTPMGQPGEIVYCIKCGQEIILGRGMFKIVMPNGKTYLSTEKLTYNEYLDLAKYLEIEVTYLDYLRNEYSKMANKDMDILYYLPSKKLELDLI